MSYTLVRRLYSEGLTTPESVQALTLTFQTFFDDRITSEAPLGQWVEGVRLFAFLKQEMPDAAIRAALGSRILDMNTNLIEAIWEYEKYVQSLAFGLPKWMNRWSTNARDNFAHHV